LALSVTSHGHQWNSALIEALGGSLQFVRLSMDGVGSTYERLRGRPFAVFETKLRSIASHYPVGINFVVNADTLPDLDAAADFAFAHDAREFLLLPEVGADGLPRLTRDQESQLNQWIEDNYSNRSKSPGGCISQAWVLTIFGRYGTSALPATASLSPR
jgi:hypothetical protein